MFIGNLYKHSSHIGMNVVLKREMLPLFRWEGFKTFNESILKGGLGFSVFVFWQHNMHFH